MPARSSLRYYLNTTGDKVLTVGRKFRPFDRTKFVITDPKIYHGYLGQNSRSKLGVDVYTIEAAPGEYFFTLGKNRYMTSADFIAEFGSDWHDYARDIYSTMMLKRLMEVLRK